MRNLLFSILFAAFAFLSLSAEQCGTTHFIEDSGFDIWCGDSLCGWELHSGSVARAPSWHKDDYSVEMIGSDVEISQLSTKATSTCIRFELLADIEDRARVTLTMDFFDDGVIDYTQELAHVRWESLVYYVATPASWRGVRFTLHKEGPGRARLAQIEATADSNCLDKPIELLDKPMGAGCTNGVECASGLCEDSTSSWWGPVCSGCSSDLDCEGDMVCGVDSETRFYLAPARTCIPPASRALGTLCLSDVECRLGICSEGVCSECAASGDCEAGDTCERNGRFGLSTARVAALCSGRGPGTLCMIDADCESGQCLGGDPVTICDGDGRDCMTDDDCLHVGLFESSTCVIAGFDPGTCQ